MQKFCQSCAIPLNLHGEIMNGTNKYNSLSNEYCKFFFSSGDFLEPDITYEMILEKGKQAIDNGRGNKIIKILMKWGYPLQLKKVKRWKK